MTSTSKVNEPIRSEFLARRLPPDAVAELRHAQAMLEHRSLSHRFLMTLGTPVDQAFAVLPHKVRDAIARGTRAALNKVTDFVISNTMNEDSRSDQTRIHKWGVMLSGGLGGLGGVITLPMEITVSTSLMLRSIASLGRYHGEDLRSPGCRLACIEVFGLGGGDGDPGESTLSRYYASRTLFAQEMRAAMVYLATSGQRAGAMRPHLLRLVELIAPRFSVMLEEKFLAQSMPVLGAIGGATLNRVFLDHYQRTARGHFIIRGLERSYGAETVRAASVNLA
jgi:hypothetical protein